MQEGCEAKTNQEHNSKTSQDVKGMSMPTFALMGQQSFSVLATGVSSSRAHGYACESGWVFAFFGRKVFSTVLTIEALETSPAVPGGSSACSSMVRMRLRSSAIASSASGSPGCCSGFGCSPLFSDVVTSPIEG
eukprot:405645-Amphidinium_carterae.1